MAKRAVKVPADDNPSVGYGGLAVTAVFIVSPRRLFPATESALLRGTKPRVTGDHCEAEFRAGVKGTK